MEDRIDKQADAAEQKGRAQDALVGGGLLIGGALWQTGANIADAVTDAVTDAIGGKDDQPAPPSNTEE